MWYNYCNEPAGETEEEAREFAKNEMTLSDLIDCLVDYSGYYKYLRWCLSQDNFWDEFMDDIENVMMFILRKTLQKGKKKNESLL